GGCTHPLGAQLHPVPAVLLLRQVDDLAVVGLAQQLLELGGLDRLALALLQLVDRLAQLLGADRALLPAEAAERLFDQAEGAVEGTASPPTPAPPAPRPPPAPAAAAAALPTRPPLGRGGAGGSRAARRLARGAGAPRPQG